MTLFRIFHCKHLTVAFQLSVFIVVRVVRCFAVNKVRME